MSTSVSIYCQSARFVIEKANFAINQITVARHEFILAAEVIVEEPRPSAASTFCICFHRLRSS